ncbi:MAG: DEAD/DEAH box helicase family protein [Methylobacteriaceae bacterium]|nr:DEAD/DEAH box helicase family protein [Methylobacteriaceae bacterium]
MKFKFKIQQFQTDAVESVVNVFNGQSNQGHMKYRRDTGLGDRLLDLRLPDDEADEPDTGYRNAPLELSESELLANIRDVQTANNIKLSSTLVKGIGAVSLDVEMETGTGKTYVYIKTMFELHQRYGWSKFIVVVPSIAIREGVKKSFEVTQEHFMDLYGLKARYFVYSSSNLHLLDEFSSGSGINVMIINIQAFATSFNEAKNVDGKGGDKAARIIYSKRDEFGSRCPIDVIRANRPIIILDEPQKMGGSSTQTALREGFGSLFSVNYSATHKTSHNLVYVLDALDAFQKKLVKKIEVKGFEIKNLRGADRYLYLEEIVLDRKKPPRARLEFEVQHQSGIKRERQILGIGDSVFVASGKLEEYKGLSITDVNPFNGTVTFSNGGTLAVGEAVGNVNESHIRRIQIRETIQSHFDKEEKLYQQDIKCLSLFFIDEVSKYRQYGKDREELLGEYGKIFEEEYVAALNERLELLPSKYQEYLTKYDTAAAHEGYFSVDKQGTAVNSAIKRGSDFSDDISAYDLILKNKERLLSFDEPTRFIFSHSALREGWDNPNVFQICTLKHSDNATAKRQEVGRGLRLCVNKEGDRQDADECGETVVHDINKLTVIASESYAGFVTDLQSRIREDLYERPTRASVEYFTGKTVTVGGKAHSLTSQEATVIYNYLVRNDYVDDNGGVTTAYRAAAETGDFAPMKAEIAPYAETVHQLVQSIFDPSVLNTMAENGHDTIVKANPLNDNFWKPEFQELWNRINHRYAYTVEFKSTQLIENTVAALAAGLSVTELTYTLTVGQQSGVSFDISRSRTKTLPDVGGGSVTYDLIGKIAEGTTLTRRTVAVILNRLKEKNPVALQMFRRNPEEFIRKVIKEINNQKADVIVECVTYRPSAEPPYTQQIFNVGRSSEGYNKAYLAKKAIQDYVFTDGTAADSIERRFAEDVDTADEVVVFAKLPAGPKGFSIPTPVGNYSPDWAIAFHQGAVKHIFFIAETKGSMDSLDLRPIEKNKIECAKKLFNEFSTAGVKYHNVTDYHELLEVMKAL